MSEEILYRHRLDKLIRNYRDNKIIILVQVLESENEKFYVFKTKSGDYVRNDKIKAHLEAYYIVKNDMKKFKNVEVIFGIFDTTDSLYQII